MEITIRKINNSDAVSFCKQFVKERVDAKEVDGAHYIGAFVCGKLVGVVGWMMIGSILRYKSDCVSPNYRGNGIYEMLFEFRDEACSGLQKKRITAFCTDLSVHTYLRHGFCSKRVGKNGITFVEK